MGLINLFKIKALQSAILNMDEEKIADIIIDFGKKEFGSLYDMYLEEISRKMARVIVAINKRRKNVSGNL